MVKQWPRLRQQICFVLVVLVTQYSPAEGFFFGFLRGDVSPEVRLSAPETIRMYNYSVETHNVVTKDGYILEIHRIPQGKNSLKSAQQRYPVLLVHGLFTSSAVWIDNTPEISLGFLLADDGFDVWLANLRGNSYSRRHLTLLPSEKQFWQFSWDHHATLDLPAIIDYILETTDRQQLLCIGHSMGTTAVFGTLANVTEYNSKIKGFAALAPITTARYIKGPVLSLAAELGNIIEMLIKTLHIYELPLPSGNGRFSGSLLCSFYPRACSIFLLGDGPDPQQLNWERLPVYFSHYPDSTSIYTVLQYKQMYQTGRFAAYDFGSPNKNIRAYNMTDPPEYNLSNIEVPIAIFWGQNDFLASPRNVVDSVKRLRTVKLLYKVPRTTFNHNDFLWGKDSRKLLYVKVVEWLKKVANEEM